MKKEEYLFWVILFLFTAMALYAAVYLTEEHLSHRTKQMETLI